MKCSRQQTFGFAFVMLAFVCAMTLGAAAQDITHPSTTTTVGSPTHEVHGWQWYLSAFPHYANTRRTSPAFVRCSPKTSDRGLPRRHAYRLAEGARGFRI